MGNYKFSGHETFQCRHFWLKKGIDFITDNGDFKSPTSVVDLGVGKNMVGSMSYWLKAFTLVDSSMEITELGKHLFSDDGYDPYIEDIGTLYILHSKIFDNSNFASIYQLCFELFRKTRIANEFTSKQLIDFVTKTVSKNGDQISVKSIEVDVKVLLKMYSNSSKRGAKTLEDDLASLMVGLNFIQPIAGVIVDGEQLYKMNFSEQRNLHSSVLLFLILEKFADQSSISIDTLQSELSDCLLCNREGLDNKLQELAEQGYLVYKQDAGRKEIQLKSSFDKWKILGGYYGRV
jgi:hypothetical protein